MRMHKGEAMMYRCLICKAIGVTHILTADQVRCNGTFSDFYKKNHPLEDMQPIDPEYPFLKAIQKANQERTP